jgi:hypothetical protein
MVNLKPATCIYTVIGYRPYTELTNCIDPNYKVTQERVVNLPWAALKNIPVGTLTHKLMTFYRISELYEDDNYVCEM